MVSFVTDPSAESRQTWNAAHYTQVKVSVNPNTAASFKAACAAREISMAGVLSKFMAEYSQTPNDVKAVKEPIATRGQRRAVVRNIVLRLEEVLLAEERYMDNIPENLQNSVRHEAAEQSIEAIQSAVELLKEAYSF